MTKRPESYRDEVLKCCRNCKHSFIFRDWDIDTEVLCHFDKSERPKCGSAILQEHIDYDIGEFDKWKEGREVWEYGVCSEWEAEDD